MENLEKCHRPNIYHVSRVRAIDVDRFLIDSDYFHGYMLSAMWDITGIEPGVIESKRRLDESEGKTFHTDTAILETLEETSQLPADTTLNKIFSRTIRYFEDESIREGLFMPGAKKFVEDLENLGEFDRREAFFLTWGSPPLQVLKLICAGLSNNRYVITQDRSKGVQISNSRDDQGRYVFEMTKGNEVIVADSVELWDDKASSFYGLPELNARGYLMRFPGVRVLPSQRGEKQLPENVEVIDRFPSLNLGKQAVKLST